MLKNRRLSWLLAVVAISVAVVAALPMTAAAKPTQVASSVSPCEVAIQQEWDVRQSLVQIKRAFHQADNRAAKQRLGKQWWKQRKALRVARQNRSAVCAEWSAGPSGPGPETKPNVPSGVPVPNSAPVFPKGQTYTDVEHYVVEDDVGAIEIATTTFVVKNPAVDPDGDPVTYSWTATTGVIVGNGLTAIWQRAIEFGFRVPGTVTLTASDGKGGSSTLVFPPGPEKF